MMTGSGNTMTKIKQKGVGKGGYIRQPRGRLKIASCSRLLSGYFNNHLLTCNDFSNKTMAGYRDTKDVLKWFFGDIPPHEAHLYIYDYFDARRAGKYAGRKVMDSTIDKEVRFLQAAINWARERRLLAVPIEEPVKFKYVWKASPPKETYLTKSQTYELLKSALYGDKYEYYKKHVDEMPEWPVRTPPLYVFIMLGLDTAARKRTIEALRWEQVSMDTRQIRLKKRNQVDTKKRRPTISLSARLHALFERLKAENGGHLGKYDRILGHKKDMSYLFARAVERIGLDPHKVTPHTLRHTFATLSLQRGVPPYLVAQVMGDSVQTVIKTYGHHCPNQTQLAVDSMA